MLKLRWKMDIANQIYGQLLNATSNLVKMIDECPTINNVLSLMMGRQHIVENKLILTKASKIISDTIFLDLLESMEILDLIPNFNQDRQDTIRGDEMIQTDIY